VLLALTLAASAAAVTKRGDKNANTIVGTPQGDNLRGGGGNDISAASA